MPRTLEDVVVFSAPGLFVVLWASGFVGAKLGLPYAEPLTFLALRMGAVVALLAVVIVVTRPKWPGPGGLVHSAATGLMVHGFYLGGVFISMAHGMPAALSALVVSLQPVLTSTLASRWLGEPVALRQWLGLFLGLIGVYLVLHDRTVAGDTTLTAWIAALAALISISAGTLYQKRYGGGIDWRPGFLAQYAAAALLFAAGAVLFETRTVRWTPEFVLALGYLVVALSLGAIWLFYFMIRRAAAARVVSLFYLTPPVTALLAWAFFDERLAPVSLLGMAICVVGVFLVNWRGGRVVA